MSGLPQKETPGAQETAIDRYVSGLKASYGKYARSADETRKLVDGSMGSSNLTELLYRSRQDSSS
jgi:hypothetical protein